MSQISVYLGLDVGTKRVGVARANSVTKFPQPLTTLSVDETIYEKIAAIAAEEMASLVVVGLPRNMSGEETQQTAHVRAFYDNLVTLLPQIPCVFQDETLSSVVAEERLGERAHTEKAAVDAMAAAVILEDYLKV